MVRVGWKKENPQLKPDRRGLGEGERQSLLVKTLIKKIQFCYDFYMLSPNLADSEGYLCDLIIAFAC